MLAETKEAGKREAWARRGAAFFFQGRARRNAPATDRNTDGAQGQPGSAQPASQKRAGRDGSQAMGHKGKASVRYALGNARAHRSLIRDNGTLACSARTKASSGYLNETGGSGCTETPERCTCSQQIGPNCRRPVKGARSRFAAGGSGRTVGAQSAWKLQAHRRNLFAARHTQPMLDRRLPPLRSLQHHLAVGCCAFPPASCSLAVALEDGFFATTVLLRVVVRRNSHETRGLMKANCL